MIIEVDEYKKKVLGYDPEQSEDFHSASAKLADKDFEKHLKTGNYNEIVFMAGGTASGKTEFSTSYLTGLDCLVYDGTLKNFDGFKVKLSKIKRHAKNNPKVKVVLIIPDDWKQAFEIFLKRERKMDIFTFFDTHIRSKLAVAKVLLETDIAVEIYTSRLSEKEFKLDYEKLPMDNKGEVIEKLVIIARDLGQYATVEDLDINVEYDIIKKL